MEQRLHKILCSVYKLVNHETNPECLNELISSRETTYTLRGKDSSNYFYSIYESSFNRLCEYFLIVLLSLIVNSFCTVSYLFFVTYSTYFICSGIPENKLVKFSFTRLIHIAKPCFKRPATAVLSWLDCSSTAALARLSFRCRI